jgi:hypothetical protein
LARSCICCLYLSCSRARRFKPKVFTRAWLLAAPSEVEEASFSAFPFPLTPFNKCEKNEPGIESSQDIAKYYQRHLNFIVLVGVALLIVVHAFSREGREDSRREKPTSPRVGKPGCMQARLSTNYRCNHIHSISKLRYYYLFNNFIYSYTQIQVLYKLQLKRIFP